MIIDKIVESDLIGKFRKAENRLVLLDYDGTLVDFKPVPSEAVPSETLLNLLETLAKNTNTELIIISGRDHKDLERMLGILPIDIIAEHGAMIREKGVWKMQVSDDIKWKSVIIPVMEKMKAKCRGSFIEEKHFSLAWHYRNAEAVNGTIHSRELIAQLENYTGTCKLKLLDGNKVVEIMNREIGKGIAVKNLVERNTFDFILSIGDDATDEEIFRLLLPASDVITIKVGNGNSFARYKFSSVSDVNLFLKHLSE